MKFSTLSLDINVAGGTLSVLAVCKLLVPFTLKPELKHVDISLSGTCCLEDGGIHLHFNNFSTATGTHLLPLFMVFKIFEYFMASYLNTLNSFTITA